MTDTTQQASTEQAATGTTNHEGNTNTVTDAERLQLQQQEAADREQKLAEEQRAANEEAAKRHAEAQQRDAEQGAALASAAANIASVGAPDPLGRAPGAASYDPPAGLPDRSKPEYYNAHPGEITSGAFNPREQSAEEFNEMRMRDAEQRAEESAEFEQVRAEGRTA